MNAKRAAAMIAIKADAGELRKGLNDGRKQLRAFGADLKKIGGKAWGGGKGALSSIGGGLGMAAGFGLSSAIGDVMGFEKNLVRFQVSAQKTDAEMGALRSSILDVSKATALSREQVLAGADEWVKRTGDTKTAAAAMKLFAKVAQATGSATNEIAISAAALRESGVGLGEMENAFSAIIAQGRDGSVELKDMAAHLAELLPQFRQFDGGAGIDGLRDLGAAFQVIMKGAGTASNAAAQFKGLMGALSNPQVVKKLQAIGIKVFSKTGKMKNYIELMKELAGNKKLTAQNIGDIFGDQQARTAILTTREQIDALGDLRAAGNQTGAVNAQFNTVMASSAMRAEKAMNNLKLAIAEAFTPDRIATFVKALEGAVSVASKLGKVLDFWSGDDLKKAEHWIAQEDNTSWFDPLGIATGMAKEHIGIDQSGTSSVEQDSALETIRGLQRVPEREERIRQAVQAAYGSAENTTSPTAIANQRGAARAGRAALGEMGVSDSQAKEILSKMQGDAMIRLLADIAAKVAQPAVLNADGNAIAKTADNATSNRGGR